MPEPTALAPTIEITPIQSGHVNAYFRCICGARWNGGPLPADVAEKFRAMFVEKHASHTEHDPEADYVLDHDEEDR